MENLIDLLTFVHRALRYETRPRALPSPITHRVLTTELHTHIPCTGSSQGKMSKFTLKVSIPFKIFVKDFNNLDDAVMHI
jgi:hypothetical protein